MTTRLLQYHVMHLLHPYRNTCAKTSRHIIKTHIYTLLSVTEEREVEEKEKTEEDTTQINETEEKRRDSIDTLL